MNNGTEERADALELAHNQLVKAVRSLVSGDDWRRMLETAKRFHDYSATNCFLILAQRPDATRVAGFRAWLSFGRHVRRGEHGIRIFAPIVVKQRADDKQPTTDAEPARKLVGFRLATVFDVSQTEGEPLPDVGPELLTADDPGQLWQELAAQVRAQGFTLERGDCGAANGYTDHRARCVRVRADVSDAQGCKTLAHELAHVLLHGADRPCRGIAEVEAESVAYLVCQSAGLASDSYSFPYVVGWANGDADLIQQTAQKTIATARAILAGFRQEAAA